MLEYRIYVKDGRCCKENSCPGDIGRAAVNVAGVHMVAVQKNVLKEAGGLLFFGNHLETELLVGIGC